ncbi:uncharacterized protein P884DRAFT_133397 [Thermothelomyces heterothallicus CBS 202.75]|uniref:uncharacterized protein n=1 Tax=Thermothelomyces heterothallicus CBS 202.75 TaxID=1149848 RepID=UPI0037445AD8
MPHPSFSKGEVSRTRSSCKQTCQHEERGLLISSAGIPHGLLRYPESLTVAKAMARLATVEASNLEAIGLLDLVLGAALGDVANLTAVGALGQTTIDNFTGISEALQVLVDILGPELAVARARGIPLEAGLFDGDQPDRDVLSAESALKLRVRGVGRGLDIDLNRLLDVVDITLLHSTLDLSPDLLGSHFRKIAAVDFAGALALADGVTWTWCRRVSTS